MMRLMAVVLALLVGCLSPCVCVAESISHPLHQIVFGMAISDCLEGLSEGGRVVDNSFYVRDGKLTINLVDSTELFGHTALYGLTFIEGALAEVHYIIDVGSAQSVDEAYLVYREFTSFLESSQVALTACEILISAGDAKQGYVREVIQYPIFGEKPDRDGIKTMCDGITNGNAIFREQFEDIEVYLMVAVHPQTGERTGSVGVSFTTPTRLVRP